MLILPETDLNQAAKTLDRILCNLAGGILEPLTFSVGLALLASCDQVQDLIRCADKAMYQAKNSGGDTVVKVVYGEEPAPSHRGNGETVNRGNGVSG